jgi:aldose 1-epimerase
VANRCAVAVLLLAGALDLRAAAGGATVNRSSFGRMPDGTAVDLYTLANPHGIEIRAITYGAVIVSVRTPDRGGRFADIVLGFDAFDDYLTKSRYFGAVVGRYGNRIAKGRFTLDGRTFQLATNNGVNHLHGGVRGFDKVVWKGEPFERNGEVGVALTYTSRDGEEGYPGTLTAKVTYTLTPNDELMVQYEASADKATPVNLTNHSYFNLAGNGDILAHQLTLEADRFTPVDETLIPTGEIAPVEGTPFDFRKQTAIGARINGDHEQLRRGNGYDHNYVLNQGGRPAGDQSLRHFARVVEPSSGRTLDVATTEPGVQFYSGNFLDGSAIGKGGHVYGRRTGFCLETQHFPDSPNHPNFPSTILRPGGKYSSKTVFMFGTVK